MSKGSSVKLLYDGDFLGKNFSEELSAYLRENRLTTKSGKSVEFVGLIELNNKSFFFVPKRFHSQNKANDLNLLLSAINKYSQSAKYMGKHSHLVGEEELGKKVNTALFLLEDWRKNGAIREELDKNKINGAGKVNWNKTIKKEIPFMSEYGPVYLDLHTKTRYQIPNKRLFEIHKKVLGDCDKNYHWFISENYLFPQIHNEEDEFDLSKEDVIFLRKYLRRVYCKRTISVIRGLINYILSKQFVEKQRDRAYGIQSFYFVWEEVCKVCFGHDDTLKRLIPQPKYTYLEDIQRMKPKGFYGQVPDILFSDSENHFVIDAKYYDVKRKSPPGWKDMVKQFFYGWSFGVKEELNIKNIFVFPGEDLLYLGSVDLELNGNQLEELGVIECIEAPMRSCIESYVKNEEYSDLKSTLLNILASKLNAS